MEGFLPCGTFEGAKKGYYFGMGALGVGYYSEVPGGIN